MTRDKGGSAFDDVVDDSDDADTTDEQSTDDHPTESGDVVSKRVESSADTDSPDEGGDEGATTDSTIDEPAFTYHDAERESVYVRPDTWDAVLDLKFDIQDALRRSHQLRDVEQRELDEAILALAVRDLDPEEIADRIVEERTQD